MFYSLKANGEPQTILLVKNNGSTYVVFIKKTMPYVVSLDLVNYMASLNLESSELINNLLSVFSSDSGPDPQQIKYMLLLLPNWSYHLELLNFYEFGTALTAEIHMTERHTCIITYIMAVHGLELLDPHELYDLCSNLYLNCVKNKEIDMSSMDYVKKQNNYKSF
jgi:hypothetical protein